MCHSGDREDIRDKIRIAGIKGLQAVVRKTVSDDLVENIWEPVHMDKIVPSLLFNMQVVDCSDYCCIKMHSVRKRSDLDMLLEKI